MKKIGIGLLCYALLFLGFSFANQDQALFKRAYEKGLISFENNLYAEDDLNRGQFSWIILKYLENVAKKEYSIGVCKAEDIDKASPLHQEALKKICQYGIMQGEKGRLYPLWKLTNAQALAVVMRIIDGRQQESTKDGNHWAINYYKRADQLGYSTEHLKTIKNAPISYSNMLKLLYSTENKNENFYEKGIINQQDPLKNLYEIMHQSPEYRNPKVNCNPNYAGMRINKINAYDDLCKDGNLKSFSEHKRERRRECVSKDNTQIVSCQANKQYSSSSTTTTSYSTNDNKAECNTSYHAKIMEDLNSTKQLCKYGDLRDFKTNTRGWTWNCLSKKENNQTSCWTEKTIKNTQVEKAECGTAINICKKGKAFNIQESTKGRLWSCKLEEYQEKCGICKTGFQRSSQERACITTNNGNTTGGGNNGGNSGGNNGGNSGGNNGGNSGGNNGGETTPSIPQPKICEGELVLNHENECVQPTPEKCFETDKRIITKYLLDKYPECGTDVIIPKKIRGYEILEIKDHAAVGLPYTTINVNDITQLTSIIFPETLQKIGESAFISNKLTKITIPNSVKEIGQFAFRDNQITSLTLGTGINTIGYSAFANNKITSLEIPTTVCQIDNIAFARNKIHTLKLPKIWDKTKCKNYEFWGNGIFNENEMIGDEAFITYRGSRGDDSGKNPEHLISYAGKAKENIVIPKHIKTIGAYSFMRIRPTSQGKAIKSINLHEGLEEIEGNAFKSNEISEVNIPTSITKIGEYAFKQCAPREDCEFPTGWRAANGIVRSEEIKAKIENNDPYYLHLIVGTIQ